MNLFKKQPHYSKTNWSNHFKEEVNQMTALEIAKYIVQKYGEDKNTVTNSMLQYALYLVQEKTWLRYHHYAFSDDIEARKSGPVIPSVYNYYSTYGEGSLPKVTGKKQTILSPWLKDIADNVLLKIQKKGAETIIKEITAKGSPWENTYTKGRKVIYISNYMY